jgi:sterol desaturase/sphingolipid hydroxylase (fatty acid hydroxylase superfamily)
MARPDRYRFHRWIDRFVLAGVVAAGAFHPAPLIWLQSFAATFVVLVSAVFAGAWIVTRWAERRDERIQGPRRKPPMWREEAWVAAQAMWVMAGLVAWPITQARLGIETGFRWSLEGTAWTPLTAVLVTAGGVVGVDAWTYWKHRALHTRHLFGFHRDHHAFRDPSAFAGFAVGPFEALWTFAPVLAVLHPKAIHWGPAYLVLVVGFVCLNLYLHCGVTVRWIEATLPRIGINTSAFHNVHHSHVRVNFAEVATWWDHLCGTRLEDGPGGAVVTESSDAPVALR